MYSAPCFKFPSKEQIDNIGRKWKLDLTPEELDQYYDIVTDKLGAIAILSRMQEPVLEVKYPRTPGRPPNDEENPLKAWCWMCDIKGAPSGPLAGRTVAIKDSISVAGVPLAYGSSTLGSYMPHFDATIVTRILDAVLAMPRPSLAKLHPHLAGGVDRSLNSLYQFPENYTGGHIIGKSSCTNHCIDGTSVTCAAGQTMNPHNKEYTPGGSSSGSGALVGNSDVDLALGGDQAGSIRIPAASCGIVGLKPTYGLVPYTGGMSLEYGMDHLGPMTRTVKVCAILLQVIAGYDGGLDPRQSPWLKAQNYTEKLTGDLTGLKIGLLKEGFDNCDKELAGVVEAAAKRMTEAGAEVTEVSVPFHKDGGIISSGISFEGGFVQWVQGNSVAYGPRGFYPPCQIDAVIKDNKTRARDLPATVKCLTLIGSYLHEEYSGRFYAKAQNLARVLKQAYNDALTTYDVLVMPTLTCPVPKLAQSDITLKGVIDYAWQVIANTCPFNATDHPALTINAGFLNGLPVGMQIVGRQFDDARVLQVAYGFECLRDEVKC